MTNMEIYCNRLWLRVSAAAAQIFTQILIVNYTSELKAEADTASTDWPRSTGTVTDQSLHTDTR